MKLFPLIMHVYMPLITSIIIKIVRNLCYGNTHLMFFLRKTTGPMAHPWETGSNKLTKL